MQKDPYSRVAPRTADLVLGVGGEIDLVSLNEASIVLAREVADSGDCLYASDADAEVEFVTRARSRYWDFKPFLDEQWRLAGERWEERLRGTSARGVARASAQARRNHLAVAGGR